MQGQPCVIDKSFTCNFDNLHDVKVNNMGEKCNRMCCFGCNDNLCGVKCNPSNSTYKPKEIIPKPKFVEDHNQLEGQMNIYDWIESVEIKETKPSSIVQKLKAGQIVYLVRKGTIKEYRVCDEKPWDIGGNKLGYRLKEDGGSYWTTRDNEIGVTTFESLEDANKVAETYLNTHNVIRASEIKATSTVAYTYGRAVDNRSMIAFYSDIGNGLLYVKGFVSFHHIVKNTQKEIKKFMEQQEFKYCNPQKIDYTPTFKNMYECKEQSEWLYTEPECSHCK